MPSALGLLQTLVARGALTPKRAADIKTSLRKLAEAADTPIEDLNPSTVQDTYPELLRTYFAAQDTPASAFTQRNTHQNLKQYFRLLDAQGLWSRGPSRTRNFPDTKLLRLERYHTSPYREHFVGLTPYCLRPDQWPAHLQEPWLRFRDERGFDVRPPTMQIYENAVSSYVGYGLQLDYPPVTSWDDLFDLPRLSRFLTWHAKRTGAKRISPHGVNVFRVMTMLARYEQRPVYAAMVARKKKLAIPMPMHNKQDPEHTISLQELETVGLALLAKAQEPLTHASPDKATKIRGFNRAIKCRDALILRLMVRVPLRSRSFREMKLHENLKRDAEGHWILEYQGDELKVDERRGRINTFRVRFPPELIDHLQLYLESYRPLWPNASTDTHVFFGRYGQELTAGDIRDKLGTAVYALTKKRFYPHLIRTLWVDSYLLATGDVSTAAYMLNDHVLTVMKRYHELRGADHMAKAYAFNKAILGNGKANGKGTSR
jgi:hypothetical protein